MSLLRKKFATSPRHVLFKLTELAIAHASDVESKEQITTLVSLIQEFCMIRLPDALGFDTAVSYALFKHGMRQHTSIRMCASVRALLRR